jgi:catechol O-methyltransferase
MHYDALPADSPLSKAMLEFTIRQAEAGGDDFTGHLSFDFLTEKEDEEAIQSEVEKEVTIYPIECNPRVHTATLLFNETPEIVDEYLSVLSESQTQKPLSTPPLSPTNPQRYYWASQDLVELVICPLYLTLFRGTMALLDFHRSIHTFAHHLLYWKDGTFEAWDPLPWLWMMHVYWPTQFAWYMATGSVWTKLNVSTGKAFQG